MKKYLLLLLLTPSLFANWYIPAITDQGCCPWAYRPCNPCAVGSFEFGIQYLMFSPCPCTWEYAISHAPDSIETQTLSITPSYSPGARLIAGWHQKCSEVLIRWWSVDSTNTEDALRPFGSTNPEDFVLFGLPVSPADGQWDEALARLRFSYSVLELRVGQHLRQRGRCYFEAFANLRWARIEQKMCIEADATIPLFPDELQRATFEERTSFNGVGLGVGASAQYCFLECIFLKADFNIMAIPGSLKVPRLRIRWDEDFEIPETMTEYNVVSCVTPAADARLAFNSSWGWKRAKFALELGWEINYYWNALSPTRSTVTVREWEDVGFSGPFVGLSALF